MSNIHIREQVRLGTLRWLHSLDLNPSSPTYGLADRDYWAWKTKDFSNGTWQGGLFGALNARVLFPFSDLQWRKVVEATIAGTKRIQRKNGSFEEAYPLESSFAVTALVMSDLACTFYKAPFLFSAQAKGQLREILLAALKFLEKTPETHGVIANHLATGLVAEHLAYRFLFERDLPPERYVGFADLQNREEGWFPEYGGADPGYQTLLNHYLIAGHFAVPLPEILLGALKRSLRFTALFCFPDGSYAGEIGSRGTSIVYPSGSINPELEQAAQPFFTWTRDFWVGSLNAVTPTNVDAGNFVPVFNSWALAWYLSEGKGFHSPVDGSLHNLSTMEISAANLIVAEAPRAKMIFSRENGALRRVVEREGRWEDESLTSLTSMGKSTQQAQPQILELTEEKLRYRLYSVPLTRQLNTPLKTVILRLLGMLLYPFPGLQRAFKKFLASLVMGQQATPTPTGIEVEINLKSDLLEMRTREAEGWSSHAFGFHKHMASANTFCPRAT